MKKLDIIEAEKEDFLTEIPLLDCIYIIPTKRKHESGYRVMEIVGYNEELNYLKKIDTYCDVIDYDDIFTNNKFLNISMDIEHENGFIRLFVRGGKIKVIFKVSSFTFMGIKKEGK